MNLLNEYKKTKDENIRKQLESRVLDVEGMLTSKVIKEFYRPHSEDEYQPLRDEINEIRKALGS